MLKLENFNFLLIVLPVYQMLFFSVQLFTLKIKQHKHRFLLGLLMLFTLFYLIVNASGYLGYFGFYRYAYIFKLPLLLSLLPTWTLLFNFYSHEQTFWHKRKLFTVYLLPTFVLTVNLFSLLNRPPVEIDAYIRQTGILTQQENEYGSFIRFITITALGLLTVQMVISYFFARKNLKYTRVTEKRVSVTKHLQAMLLAMYGLLMVAMFMIFTSPSLHSTTLLVINTGFLLSGMLLGYNAVQVDKAFAKEVVPSPEEAASFSQKVLKQDPETEEIKRNSTSTVERVSKEEMEQIISKLNIYLETERPYLEVKLTVNDLAKAIDVSPRKLTNVINDGLGSNFYGIINKYRVEESIRLIKDPDNKKYNIDAIGQMAGFQSKSSFYRYFKEETGMTPTEYKKMLIKKQKKTARKTERS